MQSKGIPKQAYIDYYNRLAGFTAMVQFIEGTGKLQVNSVHELALFLKCDERKLMRVLMKAYMPGTWSSIEIIWPCVREVNDR